ncbi:hypothetical protein F1C76_21815 [Geodermatophilaceae bacterium NBWT11]|nr:hypothetical protein F1C76_21815 [Geodermatophilaceae bacterium NBWT11]
MIGLRCPCGQELVGADEAELVVAANRHLDQRHPRLSGTYTDDDVLALAYRLPARAAAPPTPAGPPARTPQEQRP